MITVPNWIGGEPVENGAWIDDIGPATGEVIARIPRSGAADIDAAVSAAKAASHAWGRTAARQRADVLDTIADALEARADELAELESLDNGKPVKLARAMDIARAIDNFRFFAGAIRHDETPTHEHDAALSYTLRRPLGVVGLITPWNLPLYLLSWKVAPALACGNAVVCKPSELTPLTADALARIMAEVGVPRGVMNVVHGYGADVGDALVGHPDVPAISFTGGTATGARVATVAAPKFKKLSLELGGKNPTVVFDDVDVDAVADSIWRASFLNQGEICLCGSRILVHRKIHDRLVDALVQRCDSAPVGDPRSADTRVGALVSEAHREKVERYLGFATDDGGRIRCGGDRPRLPPPFSRGFFLRPAVVTDLAPTSRCSQEEIFGPVAVVHSFDNEQEALEIANGVRYGLSASVWTEDLRRAHRVAAALEAGLVWVNTWLYRDLRVPFGGIKASGLGREGGRFSLEFYSDYRNICIAL
jgi:aminomuconate-semialdehyde/2-hydroxymuconate-6-semialdehyde dehydrogenase